MSVLERKASALDRLISRNVIGPEDLAAYLDPDEVAKIRSAGDYCDELIERLNTGAQHVGLPTPWRSVAGKILFKPAELSVWTGYKGHAKTMVLSQCMVNAMSLGERVLVISPEFRPPTIIERKLRQSLGAREITPLYVQEWSKWATNKLWFYDHQGSVNPRYALAAIRYAVEKFGVTHVVVDSLMKMGVRTGPDGYDDQKRFVDQLQSIAHDMGCHIHLVAHARKSSGGDDNLPNLHDIKGTSEIGDMAENVYIVWLNKAKLDAEQQGNNKHHDEPDVIVKVEAQRNVEWRGPLSLWMAPRGLQFVDNPGAAVQVYLSESQVEF